MANRLKGKRTLITGGASGIGRACVELFMEEGARVALWDVDEAEGLKLAKRLGEGGVRFMRVDVSEEKAVSAASKEAVDWLGGLDALVNNAGVGGVRPAEGAGKPEP